MLSAFASQISQLSAICTVYIRQTSQVECCLFYHYPLASQLSAEISLLAAFIHLLSGLMSHVHIYGLSLKQ